MNDDDESPVPGYDKNGIPLRRGPGEDAQYRIETVEERDARRRASRARSPMQSVGYSHMKQGRRR